MDVEPTQAGDDLETGSDATRQTWIAPTFERMLLNQATNGGTPTGPFDAVLGYFS
jgi:hypothetical protein